MTVYLVIYLPKIPYVHLYTVLANPVYIVYMCTGIPCTILASPRD